MMQGLVKMEIIEHIENYIGEISYGIEVKSKYPISISCFNNKPMDNLNSFVSLGLNKFNLNYKSNFELLFVCGRNFSDRNIASLLVWLSELMIEQKHAILNGEIIFLPQVISPETKMNCLLVYTPFYFPNDFQVAKTKNGNVVFPLLIPIYLEEAKLIQEKGIESFEKFLLSNHIDNLWDMNRSYFSW